MDKFSADHSEQIPYFSYEGRDVTAEQCITEYEFYEKRAGSRFGLRCVDGSTAGCSRCVGYCRYDGHPGFLTGKLRQEHDCLGKGCVYYVARERSDNRTKAAVTDIYSEIRIRSASSWADFVVSRHVI